VIRAGGERDCPSLFFTRPMIDVVMQVRANDINPTINHTLERNMKTTFKKIAIRTLAVTAIASAAMGTANAGVFIYGPRVVVPAVYAAPVVVSPVVVAPAAVYVPTCRFVSMPFVNAYTGWTYMVTRRVCN
jgi:hypothetical protein